MFELIEPAQKAVGLDFGTTVCRVAVQSGDAPAEVKMYQTKTHDSAKRMLGKRYSDIQNWTEVKSGLVSGVHDMEGTIGLEQDGQDEPVPIDQLVKSAFEKVRQESLHGVGHKVVATVPNGFRQNQRRALVETARAGGFDVARLLNDTTAAAVGQYCHTPTQDLTVLVVSLGESTLGVSVVAVSAAGTRFEVKSVAGDACLGGTDFDTSLAEYLLAEFSGRHKINLHHHDDENQLAIQRLKDACKVAKEELSSRTETRVDVDELSAGIGLHKTVSRTEFEHICKSLFQRVLTTVRATIADAGGDVDEVVLVGGSTLIPNVQNLVSNLFNFEKKVVLADPDVCTKGAAIYAASLLGTLAQPVSVTDLSVFSIGMEIQGGAMSTLLPLQTPLSSASTITETFSTFKDYQTELLVILYEGEGKLVKHNTEAGRFQLTGISGAPRGVVEIEVAIGFDPATGLLVLNAAELQRGEAGPKQLEVSVVPPPNTPAKKADVDKGATQVPAAEKQGYLSTFRNMLGA